jgi:hypothetical protein
MKNCVSWDVTQCGSVPGSPILVTLMVVALSSSETSVLTRDTRRNIPEDAILQHEKDLRMFLPPPYAFVAMLRRSRQELVTV